MLLAGRKALVTGGGRGIGRAIALAFAGEEADVGVLARTAAEVEEVAREVAGLGGTSVPVVCDVRDGRAVQEAVGTVLRELGGVDIAVANAGGGGLRGSVGELDADAWEEVVRTNLLGAFNLIQAVVPLMIAAGRGHIIAIGSGLGRQPVPGSTAYAAAKAGLAMLVRCLALELREHGILVNELVPARSTRAPLRSNSSKRHPRTSRVNG